MSLVFPELICERDHFILEKRFKILSFQGYFGYTINNFVCINPLPNSKF